MVAIAQDRDMYRERSKVSRPVRGKPIVFQNPSCVTVGSRRKLDERGLDVDGSRQMLVSRLEGSNKRLKTEE